MKTETDDTPLADPFYENDSVVIKLKQKQDVVEVHWQGPYSSTHYREAMQVCLQLSQEKQLGKWLACNINLSRISQDDQEWTTTQWLPKFKKGPLKKVGLIIYKDMYSKMVIESVLTRCVKQVNFEIQYFDDAPTALSWILEE